MANMDCHVDGSDGAGFSIHPAWLRRRIAAWRHCRLVCRESWRCGAVGRLCGGRIGRRRGTEISAEGRTRNACVASNSWNQNEHNGRNGSNVTSNKSKKKRIKKRERNLHGKRRRSGHIACTRNGPARWERISSCGPNCCCRWVRFRRQFRLPNALQATMTILPNLQFSFFFYLI